MNAFEKTIKEAHFILTEGGMVERIRRSSSVELDPFIAHAGLIYEEEGKQALEAIYREYIDIAKKYDFPMFSYAPTWRANPERLKQSAYNNKTKINQDGVSFLKNIRDSYGEFSEKIFIGGLIGCKGDAYKPDEALSTEEAKIFHQTQIKQLAESKPDFIKAATMPALSEVMGIAHILSDIKIPYIISFVIKPEGTLLDGTPLHTAIEKIDHQFENPPLFFMLNCVHPSAFKSAFENEIVFSEKIKSRLLGFQANTSAKSPEELEQLTYLDTTEPAPYAKQMLDLYQTTGLKLLGGCCGSDCTHIAEIASQMKKLTNKKPLCS